MFDEPDALRAAFAGLPAGPAHLIKLGRPGEAVHPRLAEAGLRRFESIGSLADPRSLEEALARAVTMAVATGVRAASSRRGPVDADSVDDRPPPPPETAPLI